MTLLPLKPCPSKIMRCKTYKIENSAGFLENTCINHLPDYCLLLEILSMNSFFRAKTVTFFVSLCKTFTMGLI